MDELDVDKVVLLCVTDEVMDAWFVLLTPEVVDIVELRVEELETLTVKVEPLEVLMDRDTAADTLSEVSGLCVVLGVVLACGPLMLVELEAELEAGLDIELDPKLDAEVEVTLEATLETTPDTELNTEPDTEPEAVSTACDWEVERDADEPAPGLEVALDVAVAGNGVPVEIVAPVELAAAVATVATDADVAEFNPETRFEDVEDPNVVAVFEAAADVEPAIEVSICPRELEAANDAELAEAESGMVVPIVDDPTIGWLDNGEVVVGQEVVKPLSS